MTVPYLGADGLLTTDDPPVDPAWEQQGLLTSKPKRPPMVRRVLNGLQDILQGGNEAPPGYEGLLSAEDQAAARPGLLTSIIAPGAIAKSIWGSNMDKVVQMRLLAQQLGDQRAQKQAQQAALKNREQIFKKFELPPTATPDERMNAMRAMITEFTRSGDVEMVKALDSIGDKLFEPAKAPTPQMVYDKERGGIVDEIHGTFTPIEGLPKIAEKDMTAYQKERLRLAKEAAARAAQAATTGTPEQIFSRENRLADDFRAEPEIKKAMDMAFGFKSLNVALAAPQDRLSHVAALYSYIKLLDPGSVVREGEIKLSGQGRPLSERAQLLVRKLNKGGLLLSNDFDQLRRWMAKESEGTRALIKPILQFYNKRATDAHVTPGNVVRDPFEGIEFPAADAPPTTRIDALLKGIPDTTKRP